MTVAFITHSDCLLHENNKAHPENPDRLRVIQTEIVESGLGSELQLYEAPLATREEMLRVHDADYLDLIFLKAPKTGVFSLDEDTWMNPYTVNAIMRAAGAAVFGVDLVMRNEVNAAFCSIRPPGHHAERAHAMGFCFVNNVAVAAAHALEIYKLNRIAIIDFDVHHGNGTENIFRDESRVLFCSSFQHPFYPFKNSKTVSPHIINLPMPAGTTGKLYRQHVSEGWLPKLKLFKPELILVSAGFDAHEEDNLANFTLHEDDFAWLTHEIKHIADIYSQGRIVSVLEGGYALNVLGKCVVAHLKELIK